MEQFVALSPDISKGALHQIRHHLIDAFDALLQFGLPTYSGDFYQIGKTLGTDSYKRLDYGIFYSAEITLQFEYIQHSREVYGFLDLIGDLGGITELTLLIFGSVFLPISKHSFYLNVIKTLYLASTVESSIFSDSKKDEKKKTLPSSLSKEREA